MTGSITPTGAPLSCGHAGCDKSAEISLNFMTPAEWNRCREHSNDPYLMAHGNCRHCGRENVALLAVDWCGCSFVPDYT